MAKRRYRTRSRKKARGHRKSAKRVRAGKKAWKTKVRRYGSKAAAIRASFGRRRRGKGKRRAKRTSRTRRTAKRYRGRVTRRGRAKLSYCSVGKCARRPIFGGAKGMATHRRRHH